MVTSMELQRPRITPVVPQCYLGIVLEALSKPLYEPLREASLKHLTLKTVFLIAMASAVRHSVLQGLVFDPKYIQFKPKGAGVILYFSPCERIGDLIGSTTLCTFQLSVLSDFGAPNCPVRAPLRYYLIYMTEHPELMKCRRRLFIPVKDNNVGKELLAATFSRWFCTTIVDSHAPFQNSKSIPGKVKAHEVCVVATSLQLFNKVDLQAVMKAGRWSSGGTFTSFYLRDLCPQADKRSYRGRRRDCDDFLLS